MKLIIEIDVERTDHETPEELADELLFGCNKSCHRVEGGDGDLSLHDMPWTADAVTTVAHLASARFE